MWPSRKYCELDLLIALAETLNAISVYYIEINGWYFRSAQKDRHVAGARSGTAVKGAQPVLVSALANHRAREPESDIQWCYSYQSFLQFSLWLGMEESESNRGKKIKRKHSKIGCKDDHVPVCLVPNPPEGGR